MSESAFQRPQEEPYTPTAEDLARAEAQVAAMKAEAEARGPLPEQINPAFVKYRVELDGWEGTVTPADAYDLDVMEMGERNPVAALRIILGDQWAGFKDSIKVTNPETGKVTYPGLFGGEDAPVVRLLNAIYKTLDPTARSGGSATS